MPGKERHHKYIQKYVNGSTGCIYIFNVTKRESFNSIQNWIEETETCDVPIKILVGNMIDLVNNPKNSKDTITPVSRDEAVELAVKHGMEYFETTSVG